MSESKNENEMLPMSEVRRRLSERPEVASAAYVVGHWIWVEFRVPPAQEVRKWLFSLGFRFNGRRKVWQHCCGVESRRSPNDPRAWYGVRRFLPTPPNPYDERQVAA